MTQYDTKTIRYSEDGPGAYSIMITRFEFEYNDAFQKEGFKNQGFIFSKIGKLEDCDYDPRSFAQHISRHDDNYLRALLVSVSDEEIPLDALGEGQTYTPSEIETLLKEHGQYGFWREML